MLLIPLLSSRIIVNEDILYVNNFLHWTEIIPTINLILNLGTIDNFQFSVFFCRRKITCWDEVLSANQIRVAWEILPTGLGNHRQKFIEENVFEESFKQNLKVS